MLPRERGSFLRATPMAFALPGLLGSSERQYFDGIATFPLQQADLLVLGTEINKSLQPGGSPVRLHSLATYPARQVVAHRQLTRKQGQPDPGPDGTAQDELETRPASHLGDQMRFVDDEDANPSDHAVIRTRDVLTPLQVEAFRGYHDNAGRVEEPIGARPLDVEVQSAMGRAHGDRVWQRLAKVAAQLPYERLGWSEHDGDTFDICIERVSAHELDERRLPGTRRHLDGHRGAASVQNTRRHG